MEARLGWCLSVVVPLPPLAPLAPATQPSRPVLVVAWLRRARPVAGCALPAPCREPRLGFRCLRHPASAAASSLHVPPLAATSGAAARAAAARLACGATARLSRVAPAPAACHAGARRYRCCCRPPPAPPSPPRSRRRLAGASAARDRLRGGPGRPRDRLAAGRRPAPPRNRRLHVAGPGAADTASLFASCS